MNTDFSNIRLIKSWRWFGENDPVKLSWLKQMEVEQVVTALHNIPNGEVWPVKEIEKVKNKIEEAGLQWSVVESLPVTESIKTGSELRGKHIHNYKISLKNLANSGIKTVVYNFMPVLDWARTDLNYMLPDGGISMLYDASVFAAFDCFILKRKEAHKDYPESVLHEAKGIYAKMSTSDAENLAYNIIVVTQGFIDGVVDPGIEDYKNSFLSHIERYRDIGKEELRSNLDHFLKEVIPLAEEASIKLAVHPDDPPFPVLGLPRIISTMEDLEWLSSKHPSENNGIAFCAGSFSARKDNKVVEMAKRFSDRIHFAHLRNTRILENGSFYESGHLNGRVNMAELVKVLRDEMKSRLLSGREDIQIPMRPDHGIMVAGDLGLKANPGYPMIGRIKGMAEISGIEEALISLDNKE